MSDDVKLYWMFGLLGSIPVAVAVSRGTDWGVQATLGGAMIAWALFGLAQSALYRARHPRTEASR